MNKAIITIPEDGGLGTGPQVDTNGVNPITILNALKVIQKHFSQKLVREAQKAVGNDPKAVEKYLDKMCQAAQTREQSFGKRPDGGISGSFILNGN